MWTTVFKNCAFNINGRKSDLFHVTFVMVRAVLFMKCRALGGAPELLSFPSLSRPACLPTVTAVTRTHLIGNLPGKPPPREAHLPCT